jgi:hypothetical protein
VHFACFDVIYIGDTDVTQMPLRVSRCWPWVHECGEGVLHPSGACQRTASHCAGGAGWPGSAAPLTLPHDLP